MSLECVACGRRLTNESDTPNHAHWTLTEMRMAYCGDSADCQRDAEGLSGVLGGTWRCTHGIDLEQRACADCIREKEGR